LCVQVVVTDKHGHRQAPPKALAVAIDDVSTIMAFRQAIETARGNLGAGAAVIVQPMIYGVGIPQIYIPQPQYQGGEGQVYGGAPIAQAYPAQPQPYGVAVGMPNVHVNPSPNAPYHQGAPPSYQG
jgi:hypothetical protein